MRRVIILIAACLLIFSCSSKPPKRSDNAADIYVEGVNYMKAKKYDKARDSFTYIRENFPFDPISFIATVKLGDVHFERKEYILAAGVYEDFFNSHPEDENIPYVLTRLGECYEKVSLSFDRDQAYTLKAIDRYVYLRNRFPTSSYAKDVETRLKALSRKLSDRELYTGEFYYKRYQFNAAILRLEYFLKRFPYADGVDKALYYLSLSYMQLGNLQKSEFYADLLMKEYPKSPFLKTGATEATKRERKTLQLAKPDNTRFSVEERKKREIPLGPQIVLAKAGEKGEKGEKEDKLSFFDETKPIDIVSDTMEGFDKEKYVIFKGSVVARQEDLYIFSDMVEAHMDEVTNEIEKAYAKGNVKLVKKERTATCNEAIFDNKKGEIILKGNVIVYSGQDKLTGDVVTYYVNEDRVVVEGEKEKKARITLTPK
jgi:lipopolysaccharide export system protein LptA